MEGGLATCRIAQRFCNHKKIHGGIFFTGMFYSYLPNNNKRMDARLSNMQKPSASAIIKKSMEGFFYAPYAAVEPL
jgi:hypothetical protein